MLHTKGYIMFKVINFQLRFNYDGDVEEACGQFNILFL